MKNNRLDLINIDMFGRLPFSTYALKCFVILFLSSVSSELAFICAEMKKNHSILNSGKWHRVSFSPALTISNEELENVWSGKKSAKSALDSAVKRGNVLLRRFESSNR